jgi:DNA-binding XRE family transcriptional regulator
MSEKVTLVMDIRGLRREAGVTIEQAAAMTEVPKATLMRIETGAAPALENALRIARFMRTPVEEIWRLE